MSGLTPGPLVTSGYQYIGSELALTVQPASGGSWPLGGVSGDYSGDILIVLA